MNARQRAYKKWLAAAERLKGASQIERHGTGNVIPFYAAARGGSQGTHDPADHSPAPDSLGRESIQPGGDYSEAECRLLVIALRKLTGPEGRELVKRMNLI
mgnify:CR=1 FL=1